jgi:hypothetical protein
MRDQRTIYYLSEPPTLLGGALLPINTSES